MGEPDHLPDVLELTTKLRIESGPHCREPLSIYRLRPRTNEHYRTEVQQTLSAINGGIRQEDVTPCRWV